jgi:hypothetical protein
VQRSVIYRCFGHEHGATYEASVLEIVIRLLRRAQWIAVDEDLEATESHLDDLHQRMLPPFRLVTSCAPGGTLKKSKVWTLPAPTRASPPRHDRAATAISSVVHAYAIQDECRSHAAGELANLMRSHRTARDHVVGAALAGQLQSGVAPVDRDDSRASQLAEELNRIEAQPSDADHDCGAAGPNPGNCRFDRGVRGDARIGQRSGLDRIEIADRDEKPRFGDESVWRVSAVNNEDARLGLSVILERGASCHWPDIIAGSLAGSHQSRPLKTNTTNLGAQRRATGAPPQDAEFVGFGRGRLLARSQPVVRGCTRTTDT